LSISQKQAKACSTGFTLLEVMVASLIMGIAVAGVLGGIASATRNASRLAQYDRATLLARQKMNELLVDRAIRRGVQIQGPWDEGTPNAGWTARVTAFEALPGTGPGDWAVDRIELEIWWMDGATRRAFSLEGYRRGVLQPGDVIGAR
jgi:prepilin-type N-terminal cleavage/methylation domain-containing protein